MAMYQSLSISGLLTLDLHSLNNEGSEGNTMMTRMVDTIDEKGNKHTVNAIQKNNAVKVGTNATMADRVDARRSQHHASC